MAGFPVSMASCHTPLSNRVHAILLDRKDGSAKLELADIAIRDQICLANRGIRFKAQLSGLHHCAQERLWGTLL